MSIIQTKGLTKKFGDFVANRDIDLSVDAAEIRAIIGENGAGKTTLMNMLYGIMKPTSGEIIFEGKPVSFDSPKDAIGLGIGMVHQHFKLVPSLTVYENIMLGVEMLHAVRVGKFSLPTFLIDNKKEKQAIAALIKKFNFELNGEDYVKDISIGARQRVEILKMLYRDVKVLILDEPTAVLIPQEVDELIKNLKALKADGKTIIIITHKLAEVKLCADKISVVRQGTLIGTVENEGTTEESLAEMMVGRKVFLAGRRTDKCRQRAYGQNGGGGHFLQNPKR
jgi:simple sugar transport system ATP-binding protein